MSSRYIFTVWPEGKPKALTLSYDDGNRADVRLAEMMRRYGLKGTFNLCPGLNDLPDEIRNPAGKSGWDLMPLKEALKVYGDDMEVAIHGDYHGWWNTMPTNAVMADILDCKARLEAETGRVIRGAAYPYGAYNDTVKDILRLAGVVYCRTISCNGSFSFPPKSNLKPFDLLEFEATTRNVNADFLPLAHRFAEDADPFPREAKQLFYLWGHSFELAKDDGWARMEEFMQTVSGKDYIWYATNIEIFDYYNATLQLVFDALQTQVTNPTSTDIWLRFKQGSFNRIIPVPAGATVSLPQNKEEFDE